MRVAIVVAFSMFLFSCNDDRPTYYLNNTDTTFRLQALAVDTAYHIVSQDTASLQDLKQDDIKTGFAALDKVIDDMNNDGSVTKDRKEGYCWGDCCGACLELRDKSNGNRLFLIKSNCGEGGYSNHQYYFERNELKIVRDFEYTVEDATATLTEKVYFLEENTALCKQRQLTSKEYIQTFTGQRFRTKSMQLLSTNKSKMRDLKDLLNMQNYHYSPE